MEAKPCSEPDCVEAYVVEPAFTAKMKWQLGVIDISVEWTKEQWLHRLALELPFPKGDVKVIGRDLKAYPAKLAYLERFDPKWVTIGPTTLVADDTIDELEVKGTTVTLELDAAAARPFTHDARCAHRWC